MINYNYKESFKLELGNKSGTRKLSLEHQNCIHEVEVQLQPLLFQTQVSIKYIYFASKPKGTAKIIKSTCFYHVNIGNYNLSHTYSITYKKDTHIC